MVKTRKLKDKNTCTTTFVCDIIVVNTENPSETARQKMLMGLNASSQILAEKKKSLKFIEENFRKLQRTRTCRFKGSYKMSERQLKNDKKQNEEAEKFKPPETLQMSDMNDTKANMFFEALGIKRIFPKVTPADL